MYQSKPFRLACLLALALFLCLTPARADWYIGAGAYKSEAQVSDLDDDDTTAGFQLGYVFIDSVIILSGEVGSYDLGSYSDGGNDVDADAITLGGVASLAIGPFFEIYAKAGIASVDVDVNGDSEDGNEAYSGVGFSFDVLDTLDIYAEYLEFDTEVDSELLGVGIRLQF